MVNITGLRAELLIKAKSLPQRSGCYLMKDIKGIVLYVGKAKNLKARVSSYFKSKAHSSLKTEHLVGQITDFDFMLTETEAEAFVLENNLIKKFSPKYNIRLRDDKTYPYIVINLENLFPRPIFTRKFKREKGIQTFGPFVQSFQVKEVLRSLMKIFGIRDCSWREFQQRKTPCMLYQMNQCSASCVQWVSEEDYQNDLNFIMGFFSGKAKATLKEITKRMQLAAAEENFEKAALIRDQQKIITNYIDQVAQQKNVELQNEDKNQNLDICAFSAKKEQIDIGLYQIRGGLLLGHQFFSCEGAQDDIPSVLFQFYQSLAGDFPDKLVIDLDKKRRDELAAGLMEYCKQNTLKHIKVQGPRNYSSLICLVQEYAKEKQKLRLDKKEKTLAGLQKLKEILRLKEVPERLECYDIAIWQGQSPTASQIVFTDQGLEKKLYRYYHLKELPEGNNDFEMIRQVMRRRLKKDNLPDVFVIDGGKGQVSAMKEVLMEFQLDRPVIGLAKAKDGKEERLVIPGRLNPYVLKQSPELMHILVSMRDEAHRFSRKLHHHQEKKRVFTSWIDQIKGVRKEDKKKILQLDEVNLNQTLKLDAEAIAQKLGISKASAKKLKDSFS